MDGKGEELVSLCPIERVMMMPSERVSKSTHSSVDSEPKKIFEFNSLSLPELVSVLLCVRPFHALEPHFPPRVSHLATET